MRKVSKFIPQENYNYLLVISPLPLLEEAEANCFMRTSLSFCDTEMFEYESVSVIKRE